MRSGNKQALFAGALVFAGAALCGVAVAEVTGEQRAMYERILDFSPLVVGGEVTPAWRSDGSRFAYAAGVGPQRRFVEVDPASGERRPLFDDQRLQGAFKGVSGVTTPESQPFEQLTFTGANTVRFDLQGRQFDLDLGTYALREVSPEQLLASKRRRPQLTRNYFPAGGKAIEVPSPNGNLFLGVRDNNLWIRDANDDRLTQLTSDGQDRHEWSHGSWPFSAMSTWSPDGSTIAAFKVDSRQVHYMPVVHWLKRQEEVSYHMYAQAGGPVPQQQLHFIDAREGSKVAVDCGADAAYFRSLGWHPNGREFLYFWLSRDGKRVELRSADKNTGQARVLWSDQRDTFAVATMRFQSNFEPKFKLLSDGRFIVASERSGFWHLYLYGPGKGGAALLTQLTHGEFPVEDIVRVDEKRGTVFFTAHSDPKRPYDSHFLRVSLDGKQQTQLTQATGLHKIQLSPSGEYFLDTHSTVDRPAVTELRRTSGGSVAVLERADASALMQLGWKPPEEFVVKAADGKTDLWGILHKPWNFDPSRKYPVIEYIYAGPQTRNVPKAFVPDNLSWHMMFVDALSQLGFITLVVDARGTPERGKAFQDVVYGNLGRNEIADHAAAVRAVASKRSYMDLDRVGIFGTSYGGYFTTRAMLQAPDLYKVAVASAPAIDMSEPFALAVENYMGGRPQDVPAAYDYANNTLIADRLQGKYMILQPTSDVNVPFAQAMQMVQALIKAGKRYDLNIFPEGNHGFMYQDSTREHVYWQDTIREYFVEHLQP